MNLFPGGTVERTVAGGTRVRGEVGPPPRDDRTELSWATCDGIDVVVKSGSGELRDSLRREAEVLRRCEGLPTVELVELAEGADHTELVTARYATMTIAETAMMAPRERGRAVASLCSSLEQLHAGGWAHGGLTASHVLVGDQGVRFCSLSAAVPSDATDGTAPGSTGGGQAAEVADDRAALAAIVIDVLADPAAFGGGNDRRRWNRAAKRATKVLRGPGGLRRGSEVLSVLRSAGVPGTADPADRSGGDAGARGLSLMGSAAVAVVVALGAGGVAWLVSGDPGPEATPTSQVSTAQQAGTACDGPDSPGNPDTDGDGCTEVVVVAGRTITVDGTRYEVGLPGDIPRLGDWNCDGTVTVALLRSSTGQVFAFDSWAGPDADVHAQSLGTFAGAAALEDPVGACGQVRVRLVDGTLVEP